VRVRPVGTGEGNAVSADNSGATSVHRNHGIGYFVSREEACVAGNGGRE
jgi:hypothetical protein